MSVRTVAEGMEDGGDQRQGIGLLSMRKHICSGVNLHSASRVDLRSEFVV